MIYALLMKWLHSLLFLLSRLKYKLTLSKIRTGLGVDSENNRGEFWSLTFSCKSVYFIYIWTKTEKFYKNHSCFIIIHKTLNVFEYQQQILTLFLSVAGVEKYQSKVKRVALTVRLRLLSLVFESIFESSKSTLSINVILFL